MGAEKHKASIGRNLSTSEKKGAPRATSSVLVTTSKALVTSSDALVPSSFLPFFFGFWRKKVVLDASWLLLQLPKLEPPSPVK